MKENKKMMEISKISMKVVAGAVAVAVIGFAGVKAANLKAHDMEKDAVAVFQNRIEENVSYYDNEADISIDDIREKAIDELQKFYEYAFGYCKVNYNSESGEMQIVVAMDGMTELHKEAEDGQADSVVKWDRIKRYINKSTLEIEEKFEANGLGKVYVDIALNSEFDEDKVLYTSFHGKSIDEYKAILNEEELKEM